MPDLPSFDRPPVNEVVLAVAFASPPALTVAHLGAFWFEELREDLPHLEEQGPYEPPIENLGPPSPPALGFQFLTAPPSPRLWARADAGTKLVQLQRGWMAFNWTDAPGSEAPYPRWPHVEAEFLRYYRALSSFVEKEGLGTVAPQQCEVTYINRIRSGGGWQNHGDLHEVLTFLAPPRGFLKRAETTQFATAFRIQDDSEKDRGRLHITAQPAFDIHDNAPVLVLTLLARGAPLAATEEGLLSFLRLGHAWVVEGFTSATTELMHREWERRA